MGFGFALTSTHTPTAALAAAGVTFNRATFFDDVLQTQGLRQVYPIRDPAVITEAFAAYQGSDADLFSLAGTEQSLDVDSGTVPLTYLDSTASTKMIPHVEAAEANANRHYANSHSVAHNPAMISTIDFKNAHRRALDFVGANPTTHVAVFDGSGATGPLNRVARNLFVHGRDEKRNTVLFTGKEHHANQLPWQRYAGKLHCHGIPVDGVTGCVDIPAYRQLLQDHSERLRLVAVNGVSNVTGVVEPELELMAHLAHEVGALLLVDYAQGLAHRAISMQELGIDFLVASGHKTYAPGSPGLLVMPRDSTPQYPDNVGGGIVESVDIDDFQLSSKLPDREEAGTPDIIGGIKFAAALEALAWVGMDRVWQHELELTEQLVSGLMAISGVEVYGDTDLARTPRAGVVTFNIDGLHHAILSQALSDYFNIATRNECFCAQPYVKSLFHMTPDQLRRFKHQLAEGDRSKAPGMVRASLGIYNTTNDIHRLLVAVAWISANKDRLVQEYYVDTNGNAYRHDKWRVDANRYSSLPSSNGDSLYFPSVDS